MGSLHITNGDGAANVIKECGVPGDVLPWRDPMHHGPFPAGLDLPAASRLRARYLAGPSAEGDADERAFELRDQQLRAASGYENVVLWFEHDLLDQLQILQLLDWFTDARLDPGRLEMICINRFPGIDPFRGIGQLNPEQMASLYPQRRAISDAEMTLAKSGWQAFRSADPRDLLAFLEGDLSGLPFLQPALLRHMSEYPSALTGLTQTEHQLLSLAAKGVCRPRPFFVKNMELEDALFMGDTPTFSIIQRLCRSGLLACEHNPFWHSPSSAIERDAFRKQVLSLTKAGAEVLNGDRDAFDLIKRDLWLGGVHLQSDLPMWVWQAETTSLKLYKS